MTRVVIQDTSTVLLGGWDGNVLVTGPATYDADTVVVAGTTVGRGLVIVHDNTMTTLLPLHPYYMAIMPFGLCFSMFLAFITTRFRL